MITTYVTSPFVSAREYQATNPEGSDEIDLGGAPPPKGRSQQSGINLAKPADSGVSLEEDSDSDEELELSLEPESPSGRNLTGPKSVKLKPANAPDSDSEFELTLDDNSGVTEAAAEPAAPGDIFETDFEVPAQLPSPLLILLHQ